MKIEQDVIKQVFEIPSSINANFYPDIIVITEIKSELYTLKYMDFIMNKKGEWFLTNDFNEYIIGHIAGGRTIDKNLDYTSSITIIIKDGKIIGYPEYNFINWNIVNKRDDLELVDENEKIYIIGKSTNYELEEFNEE